MVEDLDAILAIWDQLINKFSPTIVEGLNVILAIWDELNYNFFSNHAAVVWQKDVCYKFSIFVFFA